MSATCCLWRCNNLQKTFDQLHARKILLYLLLHNHTSTTVFRFANPVYVKRGVQQLRCPQQTPAVMHTHQYLISSPTGPPLVHVCCRFLRLLHCFQRIQDVSQAQAVTHQAAPEGTLTQQRHLVGLDARPGKKDSKKAVVTVSLNCIGELCDCSTTKT
jgi:hypothetical protein